MMTNSIKPTTLDLGRTIKWLLSGQAKRDIKFIHDTNMEKLDKTNEKTKKIHQIVAVENHLTMKLMKARGGTK